MCCFTGITQLLKLKENGAHNVQQNNKAIARDKFSS